MQSDSYRKFGISSECLSKPSAIRSSNLCRTSPKVLLTAVFIDSTMTEALWLLPEPVVGRVSSLLNYSIDRYKISCQRDASFICTASNYI